MYYQGGNQKVNQVKVRTDPVAIRTDLAKVRTDLEIIRLFPCQIPGQFLDFSCFCKRLIPASFALEISLPDDYYVTKRRLKLLETHNKHHCHSVRFSSSSPLRLKSVRKAYFQLLSPNVAHHVLCHNNLLQCHFQYIFRFPIYCSLPVSCGSMQIMLDNVDARKASEQSLNIHSASYSIQIFRVTCRACKWFCYTRLHLQIHGIHFVLHSFSSAFRSQRTL